MEAFEGKSWLTVLFGTSLSAETEFTVCQLIIDTPTPGVWFKLRPHGLKKPAGSAKITEPQKCSRLSFELPASKFSIVWCIELI